VVVLRGAGDFVVKLKVGGNGVATMASCMTRKLLSVLLAAAKAAASVSMLMRNSSSAITSCKVRSWF
jgi:hypothetical protein